MEKEDYFDTWLNKPRTLSVFNEDLLKELKNYNPTLKWKVQRILRMCLKHQHFNWAKAIQEKYRHYLEKDSDFAVAMGMALMAQKNKQQP